MAVSHRNNIWKTQLFGLFALAFLSSTLSNAQYTEVINSNRPGESVGAFAVGTGVIQLESGFFYEQRDHSLL